jgi:hypothetical protein
MSLYYIKPNIVKVNSHPVVNLCAVPLPDGMDHDKQKAMVLSRWRLAHGGTFRQIAWSSCLLIIVPRGHKSSIYKVTKFPTSILSSPTASPVFVLLSLFLAFCLSFRLDALVSQL